MKDNNTFWVKENTKFITVTPDPGVTTTRDASTSTRAPTSPTTTEPDGFPPESCTTMAPEYEVDAQDGPCPFEIVALEVKSICSLG